MITKILLQFGKLLICSKLPCDIALFSLLSSPPVISLYILSIFSTQIKNGNGINIFEDGKESRDFVFVDDVVDATILGIEKDEANNEVFNVGTGIPTDVITVANGLIKNYGISVPVTISGNYRLGDIRHNYADLTKIKRRLGFEPKFSFEQGLKLFTNWVDKQEVQQDNYAISIEEMKAKGLYK